MWPFNKKEIRTEEPKKKRGYNAGTGGHGRLGRLFSTWVSASAPPDKEIRDSVSVLRARSRDLYRNNDYAKRYITTLRDKIIGPDGVTIKPKAKNADGTPDFKTNQAIIREFEKWSRKENADFFGCNTWAQIQRQFITSLAMDGEALILKEFTGEYGIQFRHLDPELLPRDYDTRLDGGRYVKAGIEYDSLGRITAYHLMASSKEFDHYQYGHQNLIRVPRDRIIHSFLREFVDQSRGVPWMVTAMGSIRQLGGYQEAALVASRIGASKMGFITTPDGEYTGPGEDVNGDILNEVEPGIVEVLPEGTSFSSFNPDYPHNMYGSFVKATLRGIAAGLGISYSTLTGDLEATSYSSIRAGAIEERDLYKALQSFIIDEFIRPAFEAWLFWAISLGKIPEVSILEYEELKNASYFGRRWQWVDPKKELDGAVLAINNNLRSRASVIREMGGDPIDTWEEIAHEKEVLEALGLTTVEPEAPEEPGVPEGDADDGGGESLANGEDKDNDPAMVN